MIGEWAKATVYEGVLIAPENRAERNRIRCRCTCWVIDQRAILTQTQVAKAEFMFVLVHVRVEEATVVAR